VHVFDEDFVDHAAFAGPAVVISHVRGCPEDPEADFTGCVTAEHGAVLDECHFDSGASRGDGAADAGESAADHGEVAGDFDEAEIAGGGGWFDDHGWVNGRGVDAC